MIPVIPVHHLHSCTAHHHEIQKRELENSYRKGNHTKTIITYHSLGHWKLLLEFIP